MKRALEVLNKLVADGALTANPSPALPRPLTSDQYAKVNFRKRMAALPFGEKVRCVVEMQKRLVPIMAARGRTIVPWTL